MHNLTFEKGLRPSTDQLAMQLEALMVAGNLRGMATVRDSGYRGYLRDSVQALLRNSGRVAIVSGFPVGERFETDGPAGAIALANGLQRLGAEVALVGAERYAKALRAALPAAIANGEQLADCVVPIDKGQCEAQLRTFVSDFQPTLVIFIEVPGVGRDGTHRNMRFEDISAQTLTWELLLQQVICPTLAIGDGGNELGMGLVATHLQQLPVACASASTDHLVLADVSNWGAYTLLALASACVGRPLLTGFELATCLNALVDAGFVDGVTQCAAATEDGLPLVRSESFIAGLQALAAPIIAECQASDLFAADSFAMEYA
uniref:glutamate cyclase domain-containing protein n=1 Tax=Microbulbifer agarilyticus TaxID=260552 RepID=UPI00025586E3|nr:glutamate cyclase domain-containing protein [Microbulbifer agarilyticus]